MAKAKVKVGIVGYGMIGARCADAITLQPDMELVGVAARTADYRIKSAYEKGYEIYASPAERLDQMARSGITLAGTIDDLLKEVDIVIDATPAGVGAEMKPLYEKAGVKAIFQGGEKHELAGHSFVAQINYETALGRQYTRVVSCNTTGICRVAGSLFKAGLIDRVWIVIARRATDPWKSHVKGIINTVVPETRIPSHQGPDAQSVIPELPIVTIAAKGPYNVSHMHFAIIKAPRKVTKEEVVTVLEKTRRVCFVDTADNLVDLNAVLELMKLLGRPMGDMWEVAVWRDILATNGDEIYLIYQVHNLAIVIPENIDAIRALTELETNPEKSMDLTDKTLGIKGSFFSRLQQPKT
ncbi:type II glyceraldehyde-3-phosphate dehydrogenase [Candidatus Bathyarchaeota archaeon]|nr:MAG: type II glyceraldehyde-3-phosphate dehydrogenase [Candidatus Hecatellales archaeon]RLI35098.1 MAG: type II glyceraldehyde-3-phosphate dehydrogenase [Candidatus Bathyarchaeota archaeon]